MGLFSFLPSLKDRVASSFIADTGDVGLRRTIDPLTTRNAGHTGTYLLPHPHDALAARVRLVRSAERTLDVQYYIFYDDLAGTILQTEIKAAADRGVRVRYLIDDNETVGMDHVLVALDKHPNIEVRVFNPSVFRSKRLIGLLLDFRRLNRRMHNKSITADNLLTIVGGRNIGDEYFSARENGVYMDMDAISVGPLVQDVSEHFDKYWNSDSSYPLKLLFDENKPPRKSPKPTLREKNASKRNQKEYFGILDNTDYLKAVHEGQLALQWSEATLVVDPPEKVLGRTTRKELMITELWKATGVPEKSLHMVEGYFVPTQKTAGMLCALAKRGVSVIIYTNSFQTSDVWIVMAGYGPYRKQLLQAGVKLYEMRSITGEKPQRSLTGSSKTGRRFNNRPSTLHAKSFSVDGNKLFVGSFNFDPRSISLNTEMGALYHNEALTQEFDKAFHDSLCAKAYELSLTKNGDIAWSYNDNGTRITLDQEPATKLWQRVALKLISYLPIQWLL